MGTLPLNAAALTVHNSVAIKTKEAPNARIEQKHLREELDCADKALIDRGRLSRATRHTIILW
jgi:hypothetical protein